MDLRLSTEVNPPTSLRQRSKRRRTERILEAARALLRDDPDGRLTVERIADRAEVAPGTVFNLVGTRDQIWAALADSTLGALDLDQVGERRPARDRAHAIVAALLRVVLDEPAVFRAVFSHWAESARAIHADPTDALVRALEQGVEEGSVTPDAPVHRLAETITAGIVGLLHQWSARLISDRVLRSRGRDLVDFAFDAAGDK
jgi:AcrR family transcriptional regulator